GFATFLGPSTATRHIVAIETPPRSARTSVTTLTAASALTFCSHVDARKTGNCELPYRLDLAAGFGDIAFRKGKPAWPKAAASSGLTSLPLSAPPSLSARRASAPRSPAPG